VSRIIIAMIEVTRQAHNYCQRRDCRAALAMSKAESVIARSIATWQSLFSLENDEIASLTFAMTHWSWPTLRKKFLHTCCILVNLDY